MHQGMMVWLLAAMISTAAADEAWRWQDGNGTWHFSSRDSAPTQAQGFELPRAGMVGTAPVASPSSVPGPVGARKSPGKHRARHRQGGEDDPGKLLQQIPVGDREQHRQLCEKWHDKLQRERHFDHEAQDAYDRECILKVHW